MVLEFKDKVVVIRFISSNPSITMILVNSMEIISHTKDNLNYKDITHMIISLKENKVICSICLKTIISNNIDSNNNIIMMSWQAILKSQEKDHQIETSIKMLMNQTSKDREHLLSKDRFHQLIIQIEIKITMILSSQDFNSRIQIIIMRTLIVKIRIMIKMLIRIMKKKQLTNHLIVLVSKEILSNQIHPF